MTTEIVNTETGEILETMNRAEAEDFVRFMRAAQEQIPRRVIDAYRRRAWIPLGYASWDVMIAAEGLAVRLPRGERQELVMTYSAAGLSTRAIAPVVGASIGTVHADQQVFSSEHLGTSQDAPETPLAENGISEPAEAMDAEGPEPAPSLSQVGSDEAVPGLGPASADDSEAAVQPERGVDPTSPPAPSNVIGIDGKTYKRPEKKTPRRAPLTDSFWRTVHEARKKVESLHRLVEDDRWTQNAEKVAATHRNDLLWINDLLQQVINSLPAEESTQ